MSEQKFYTLPELPYGYGDLAPHMSEEQLKIHHDIHHNGYVKGANAILEKLDESRNSGHEPDMKAVLKNLSFNIGGHVLHSLFWENMAPENEGGGGEPEGKLKEELLNEFKTLDRFMQEFTAAAATVEGSGWAALTYCLKTNRPIIMQIEKHNTNLYPSFNILMVLDLWEHAYYLDYQNKRPDFINAFWKIVNWETVAKRLGKIL